MKYPIFLLLLFSFQAFAIKGEYVDSRKAGFTCKLTLKARVEGEIREVICTGSFIGNKTFSTADHCLKDVKNQEILFNQKAVTEKAFFTCPDSETHYPVKDIFSFSDSGHSEYQDLGLLKVENEVSAPKVLIPDSSEEIETALNDSKNCFIAGYGLDNDNLYGVLKVAQLKNSENKPIDIHHLGSSYRIRLTKNFADHGDSGGPLYCETKRGMILIGATHGGLIGDTFSDTEKLNQSLDWVKYLTSKNNGSDEFFRKYQRIIENCESMALCLNKMKEVGVLTTQVNDVLQIFFAQTRTIRSEVTMGKDVAMTDLDSLWDVFSKQWDGNDCFKKLYP
ncbi:MAG: trypsin-like serine protease [Bacteriovoracaceae bacterium]